MYRISGNFSDDLLFAFFVISFELQTTNKCSEIIFCIIFYKKLAKNDCSKLKMLHVFPILQICATWKKLDIRYILLIILIFDVSWFYSRSCLIPTAWLPVYSHCSTPTGSTSPSSVWPTSPWERRSTPVTHL